MMFAVTAVGFVLFVGLCLGSPTKYEVEEIDRKDSDNIVSLIVEDFYVEMPVWEDTCYVRPVEIVSQSELSSGHKLMTTCTNTTVALGIEGLPKDVGKVCEGKQLYALDQCGDKHDTDVKREKRSCSCYRRWVCPSGRYWHDIDPRICDLNIWEDCQYKWCCPCFDDWVWNDRYLQQLRA